MLDIHDAYKLEEAIWNLRVLTLQLEQLQEEAKHRPMTDTEDFILDRCAKFGAHYAATPHLPQPNLIQDKFDLFDSLVYNHGGWS